VTEDWAATQRRSQLREITDRIDAIPAGLDQISANLSAAMRRNGRHKT
jgi:hypothetical protein